MKNLRALLCLPHLPVAPQWLKKLVTSNHRSDWQFTFVGNSTQTRTNSSAMTQGCFLLASAEVGAQLKIMGGQGVKEANLKPGMLVNVVSRQPSGSVIVAVLGQHMGLSATLTRQIEVESASETAQCNHRLHNLAVGTVGRIVSYDRGIRGYRHKLLSMGLTPGTEVKTIRVAPLGDPMEILVRGFHLSLRKKEAEVLVIEPVKVCDSPSCSQKRTIR
jgi:ferrous iron transport protein A